MAIEPTVPRTAPERARRLAALQQVKMALSANAFVRGHADLFYSALAEWKGVALPSAPDMWISGDCHVENIGAVADVEGDTEIELNDFDEAVGGNPAHDLIRLALSSAMEGRAAGLSGMDNCALVRAIAEGYERITAQRARNVALVIGPTPERFQRLIRRALKRTHKKLRKHFELGRVDSKRVFPMGERYWPLSNPERAALVKLLHTEDARTLITALAGGKLTRQVEVVDVAFRVAGTGSLGAFRAAAIVQTDRSSRSKKSQVGDAETLRMLDIKEALREVAPRSEGWPTPRDHSERIVAGARVLCPRFGERMIGARLLGRSVVIRELMPEEKKAKLAALDPGEVVEVGQFLGAIVARAHARQMTAQQAREWLRALGVGKKGRAALPRWLWETLVHLIGLHEQAYLHHCQRLSATSEETVRRTRQEEDPHRRSEKPRAGFARP